jgi:hypothetical protein
MLNRQKLRLMAALFSLVFSTQIFAGKDEPIILKQPENISQCIGGTEKLEITLNEGVKATIQWQFSRDNKYWDNVNSATDVTFTPDSKEAKTTWYRVAVTTQGKDARISLTTSVKVEVVETAKVDVTILSKGAICDGEKICMKATRKGGAGECTIQWQTSNSSQKEWTNIEGETKEEFTAPSITKNIQYRAIMKCTGSGCCN